MAAITLESDSSHSPPVLYAATDVPSPRTLETRRICLPSLDACEKPRTLVVTFSPGPENFRAVSLKTLAASSSAHTRKVNVVKIRKTTE